MQAVIRIIVCEVCARDPAFGAVHLGCGRCTKLLQEREQQPKLVCVNAAPLTYAEKSP